MSRRAANNSILGEIAGLVALCTFCFLFVPVFRLAVLWTGAAVLALGIIWVIHRVAKKGTRPNLERNHRLEVSTPKPAQPKVPSLQEKLRTIDWFQFEKLVCAIYQAKGYAVKRSGGAQPDGGVDLLIEQGGVKTVVQCKHWKKWSVGVKDIREFLGAMTDRKISNGIFVTMQGYTPDARALAQKHNISLLEQKDLVRLLEETGWKLNPDMQALLGDTRKFCPRCEKEMVLRTAGRGFKAGKWFWGCSGYPKCRFTLKID